MSGRTFLDTNVLVYAFDAGEPRKRDVALQILAEADPALLVISSQVMSEFHVTVTRKLQHSLPPREAARAVAELSRLEVVAVTSDLVLAAVRRSRDAVLSHWDALIIETALHARCERLLTEDLTDGQRFDDLVVENPFASPQS